MKTAIVITTYNRPEYLSRCLDSVCNTFIGKDSMVYIIDDASSNRDTRKLIDGFSCGCTVVKEFKKKNTGILNSLVTAYGYCFDNGYDYVIALNDDAIVNNYFFDMMVYYKTVFPNHIISGFNTLSHSELRKPRHPIIQDEPFYCLKNTSGGLCFGIDRRIYDRYFLPTILNKINICKRDCYDTKSTLKASADKCFVICVKPSVVEHMG